MQLVDQRIRTEQAEFTDLTVDNINDFNRDIVDYLYDVEPQSQNLFMIANFSEQGEGSNAIKQFSNAQFRCRDIKLPDLSFTFDIDKLTHVPILTETSYDQEITIDWFEDVYHSVWKYHDDWMRRWYDKTYNVLRCGVAGKFRKLDLLAYHFKTTGDSILSDTVAEPIFVCTVAGMVPATLNGMKFDYNNDGNDELLSVTYKAARIDIRYNSKFTSTADNLYDTNAAAAGGGASKEVWAAEGISSEGAGSDDTMTNEQLRITRAATTRYDSMPRWS